MVRSPNDPARSNCGNLFQQIGPIEYRRPSDLIPYPGNPRQHSQRQLTTLKASISAFGFLVPVLITAQNEIVSGDARVQAAKDLEVDRIPTIFVEHLTPEQVRVYRIADNRTSELGEWDEAKLAIEFKSILDFDNVEIDLTGFETAQIDVIIDAHDAASRANEEAEEYVPEPKAPISRTGDMWAMDEHRVGCGPSQNQAAWQQLMNGDQAAMVFTDPPYNVRVKGHVSGTGIHSEFAQASGDMSSEEFTGFLAGTLAPALAHLKDGGILFVCMDWRHMRELQDAAERIGLRLINMCVWNKCNGGQGSLYRSKYELVFVFKKGNAAHTNNVQLGRYGRYRTNVWDYAGANSFSATRNADLADHPTVKPTPLVADAIRDVSHPGEIVIDGFLGSGATLLAAELFPVSTYGTDLRL